MRICALKILDLDSIDTKAGVECNQSITMNHTEIAVTEKMITDCFLTLFDGKIGIFPGTQHYLCY